MTVYLLLWCARGGEDLLGAYTTADVARAAAVAREGEPLAWRGDDAECVASDGMWAEYRVRRTEVAA